MEIPLHKAAGRKGISKRQARGSYADEAGDG